MTTSEVKQDETSLNDVKMAADLYQKGLKVLNNVREAMFLFEQAIEKDSSVSKYHFMFAKCCSHYKRHFDTAEKHYKKAIKLEKENVVQHRAGYVEFLMKKERDLNGAADLNIDKIPPKDMRLADHTDLLILAQFCRKFYKDKALTFKFLDMAIVKANKNVPKEYYEFDCESSIYFGELQSALTKIHKSSSSLDKSPVFCLKAAWLHYSISSKDVKKALEWIEKAKKSTSKSTLLYVEILCVQIRIHVGKELNNFDAATKCLEELSQSKVELSGFVYEFMETYFNIISDKDTKSVETALTNMENLCQQQQMRYFMQRNHSKVTTHISFFYNLTAECFEHVSRNDACLYWYNQSLKFNAYQIGVLWKKMQLLEQKKDYVQAIQALKFANTIDETNEYNKLNYKERVQKITDRMVQESKLISRNKTNTDPFV